MSSETARQPVDEESYHTDSDDEDADKAWLDELLAENGVTSPSVDKLFSDGPAYEDIVKKKKKNNKGKRRTSQMMIDDEPNTLIELDSPDDLDLFAATLYEDSDDEVILNTEEETEVEVALDSGCVKHCFGTEDLPRAARNKIRPPPPNTKDFIGAGGHGIKRHGSVMIQTQQDGFGPVNQVVQAADVTRPLHALCQIADTEKEILYTKGEATVVPGGSLSKYLKYCKKLAEYKRKGGLYIGKMKIRVSNGKPPDRQPFRRQGQGR